MQTARPAPRFYRLAVVAAAGLLAVLGSSCSITSQSQDELRSELRKRPTYEDASTGYIGMLTGMRASLKARIPGLTFDSLAPSQRVEARCENPYADVRGTNVGAFVGGTGSQGVAEGVWPSVRQDLIDLAAKHGFTKVVSVHDTPTDHSVAINDQWGGSFEFAADQGMVLGVFSPCLLHDGS